jgi:lipopolysaccharide transport system permease protein
MKMEFPRILWLHRDLIWRMTERQILGRYRGSFVGLGWSFLQPLAMLAVYTFVFSQVFQARWGTLNDSGPIGFAINLFSGLIVFNLFSESANSAPMSIVANPNYVKKVIFPLEVLSASSVLAATFSSLISLVVLAFAQLVTTHSIPPTYLWIPIVWLPLVLLCLALSWVLGALGVFLRDTGQIVGVATSMLMFLSPIFFPISALPPNWRPVLKLNPIADIIEQTRRVTVEGLNPDLAWTIGSIALGFLACELSCRAFKKAKKAFADVM